MGEILKLLTQSQTPRPESGGYTRSRVYSSFTSNRPTTSKPEASLEAQTVDPTRQSHPMRGSQSSSSISERVWRNRTESHRLGDNNILANRQSPGVPYINEETLRNPLLQSWESRVVTESSHTKSETSNLANNKQNKVPSLSFERPLPSSSSLPIPYIPVTSSPLNEIENQGRMGMTEKEEDVEDFPVLAWGSPEGRDSSEGDWEGQEKEHLPWEDKEQELEADVRSVCGFEGEKWLCLDLEEKEKSQEEDDGGKVCGYEGDKWICLDLEEDVESQEKKKKSHTISINKERVPRGQDKNSAEGAVNQNHVRNQGEHKLSNNQKGYNNSESVIATTNPQEKLDKIKHTENKTLISEDGKFVNYSKFDQEAGRSRIKSPGTEDRKEIDFGAALEGRAGEEKKEGAENYRNKQSRAEDNVRKSQEAAITFIVMDTDNDHNSITKNLDGINTNATKEENIETLGVKGEGFNKILLGDKKLDEEGNVANTETASKAEVDDDNPEKSGSCAHLTDSSMRIRCKVIACFRNPDNCYS